jgi:hypothetical protein
MGRERDEDTNNVRRMSDSVLSRMDFPFATPALLIRTVGFPKCALISEDADAMEAGEARSHLKNLTVGWAILTVSFVFLMISYPRV